ncbi:unnamed protein product [Prorocentrum cordatum]|uniref:ISXO2-like transposase domain-containing protein n=1 Tax=Prorocentrum cordatum TaxID=2364126 RepID=A0ABN9RLU5_9DINO|nr:unnamed protein product [Polarella glacialis]
MSKQPKCDFLNQPMKQVISKLKKDSILPEWKGVTCPYCNVGVLGPLQNFGPKRGGWSYRCGSRGCRRHVLPHSLHPVFRAATGASHTSLPVQASILFCAVSGCTVAAKFRKRDWCPLATKWLKGRSVILHTDGARSYKLKVPGVTHDWVVHMKKRVKINGKFVWIKPLFSKVRKHVGIQKVVGSKILRDKIRSAQWCYWNCGCDLWAATGDVFYHEFERTHLG